MRTRRRHGRKGNRRGRQSGKRGAVEEEEEWKKDSKSKKSRSKRTRSRRRGAKEKTKNPKKNKENDTYKISQSRMPARSKNTRLRTRVSVLYTRMAFVWLSLFRWLLTWDVSACLER